MYQAERVRRQDYVINQCLTIALFGYNRAFEEAYILGSDPCAIPQVSAQISALDADLFRNFVISIMQLIGLTRALEVLVVRSSSTLRSECVMLSRLSSLGLTGYPRSR